MRILVPFLFSILLSPTFAEASVIITEVMYDLPGTDTGREWIEITNVGSSPVDVRKYKFFEADTNHAIAPISGSGVLSPGSSAVIADNPTKFKIDWPQYSGELFDSPFSLSNTGESLVLKDSALVTLDSISYDRALGAAGDGTTLKRSGITFISAMATPGTHIEVTGASTDSASVPTASATVTPLPTVSQPSASPTSYKKVQKVEVVTSTKTDVQTHDEAVEAPAVTTEIVAVGAALPLQDTSNRASNIFYSPWALGFIVVMVLAGAAFIFL